MWRLMGAKEGVLATRDINEVVTAAVRGTVRDGVAPDALTHPYQETANPHLRQHFFCLRPADDPCSRI